MAKSKKTKTEIAWGHLFEKYNILQEVERYGKYIISADEIREFREPRLMAKFDHSINLPDLFINNNLSILPITRGNYIISHINTYHKFEVIEKEVLHIEVPSHIQSLTPQNIKGESIALNFALISGVFEDFLEDSELCPTVCGRMGTDKFSFEISSTIKADTNVQIQVENSQIEIDAAYEGINYLTLIEAKCDISDDFLIRQIYYPYRVWKDKVDKEIKLVFLVYSNSVFSLYEYAFDNPNHYNSLKLKKQKDYSIEDMSISVSEIEKISSSVTSVEEPKVPFPQADNFKCIINLCELLMKEDLNKEDITNKYAFDNRQTDYYTNAGRYLGIIGKKQVNGERRYFLTAEGFRYLKLPYKQRQLEYVRCILSHELFNEILISYFKTGEMPEKSVIVDFMKKYKLYNINSDSTYFRRSSTVESWISWIVCLINYNDS
ncbi:type II restriction enzyme [Methanoplanus endosymbiosus]|uniref:Translation elongation factor n=1 Tax=Methanoplanus endosymbiosus TaxID=33865 RepID=A0A9E7PM38_9EURY|nr:hypothetical protein [Methanoplanus endosymbiosus]UUX91146.1 hypothetical protein L6E24_07065 [Methanoplanus endosymbiosus]